MCRLLLLLFVSRQWRCAPGGRSYISGGRLPPRTQDGQVRLQLQAQVRTDGKSHQRRPRTLHALVSHLPIPPCLLLFILQCEKKTCNLAGRQSNKTTFINKKCFISMKILAPAMNLKNVISISHMRKMFILIMMKKLAKK